MSRYSPSIRTAFLAAALLSLLPHGISAAGTEPAAGPPVDTAPCMAAISANDDRIIATCGVVIDSDKTEKTDRIKALIDRAGAWQRKDMIDRAIGDYSTALQRRPIFSMRVANSGARKATGQRRCRISAPRPG